MLFSYQPANEDELELQVNDIIDVMTEVEEGWWKGKLRNRVNMIRIFICSLVTVSYTHLDVYKRQV